jgi:hypothetical protein
MDDDTTPSGRRPRLYSLLGDLPDRARPISAELIAREERELYVLEVLLLDLNGIELVPAYFTRPLGTTGPTPAVLYNHAHGGDYVLGKDEFLRGRTALQAPPYADALAGRGIAGLCIDAWNFGERRGRTESERWQLVRYATGHLETADMRRRVLAFLDRYLCDDAAVNAERLRPQGMRESRPGRGGPISSAMNNAGSNR